MATMQLVDAWDSAVLFSCHCLQAYENFLFWVSCPLGWAGFAAILRAFALVLSSSLVSRSCRTSVWPFCSHSCIPHLLSWPPCGRGLLACGGSRAGPRFGSLRLYGLGSEPLCPCAGCGALLRCTRFLSPLEAMLAWRLGSRALVLLAPGALRLLCGHGCVLSPLMQSRTIPWHGSSYRFSSVSQV